MKSIEEQIWEYIDGQLTAKDRAIIAENIANDQTYALIYAELMELHQLICVTELEEPSMAFTRNIMDKVNLVSAPMSLKTKVDTRIIYSLAAVFLLAIVAVSIYAIANSTFTFIKFSNPSFNFSLNLQQLVSPIALQTFVFLDIILALLYLDRFYRSKKA
ncbi:anti-sigma-K factor RskA [Pedobacter sp. CG_S7]|uniref:hypothetical protein n=1 Tax=Pedobacter sp. CG_S7 TaxID=3143930 RepID=UPI0033996F74